MANTILIVPYDPRWPDEFEQIGSKLRRCLGNLALRVDHIGSTSVPGLAAKDIIDVQVTVRSLNADELTPPLSTLGYELRGDIGNDHIPPGAPASADEWQKLYFRAPPGQRPTHLHVRAEGRANQRYPLLFRDYLRASPAASEAYQQVKVALARLHPDDVEAYYDVKDPVCDIIMDAANRWAVACNYRLGESDV